MATPTSLLSPSPPLPLLKPIKTPNIPPPFPPKLTLFSSQLKISIKPFNNWSEIGNTIAKTAILGAGFGVILVCPAYSAEVSVLGNTLQLSEPSNALSLPTWAIHISSVVEWITAMVLVWQYGEKSGYKSWKGLSWGMVPLLGGALCACTWHFFYNSEDLEVLVALQAALTVIGNATMCLAALRIYKASQEKATNS